MKVNDGVIKMSPQQLDYALKQLSRYFGDLVDFRYDPEKGICADFPADLNRPDGFERTCTNVVRNAFESDRIELAKLRL